MSAGENILQDYNFDYKPDFFPLTRMIMNDLVLKFKALKNKIQCL